MSSEVPDTPGVLVVCDDRVHAELYATWLAGTYEVTAAYDGPAGLASLDEDVDVVLLDGSTNRLSGAELQSGVERRDLTCRAALVTSARPDFDVIEAGFDDYVAKPVEKADLLDLVDRLTRRATYDETVGEYFRAVRKRELLRSERSQAALRESEEYQRLEDRIARLGEATRGINDELDPDDYRALFRELAPEQGN